MKTITIFACEAQPIVIEGLNKILSGNQDFELVGSASNLTSASPAVGISQPDIVLLDTAGGLKSTLQFVGELKFLAPSSQAILWVNDLAEMECFRALQLGARGVVKKTLPVYHLINCLKSVAGGNVWVESSVSSQMNGGFGARKGTPRFTPRERDIVGLVCKGLKNKEIAGRLIITPGTVKVHLMHIFEKAGVKDRFELAGQGNRLLGPERTHLELARVGLLGQPRQNRCRDRLAVAPPQPRRNRSARRVDRAQRRPHLR